MREISQPKYSTWNPIRYLILPKQNLFLTLLRVNNIIKKSLWYFFRLIDFCVEIVRNKIKLSRFRKKLFQWNFVIALEKLCVGVWRKIISCCPEQKHIVIIYCVKRMDKYQTFPLSLLIKSSFLEKGTSNHIVIPHTNNLSTGFSWSKQLTNESTKIQNWITHFLCRIILVSIMTFEGVKFLWRFSNDLLADNFIYFQNRSLEECKSVKNTFQHI